MASESMTDQPGGTVIAVGDLSIDPVAKVVVHVEQVGSGIVGLAVKRPTAIIVRSQRGTFRIELGDPEFTGDSWSS
jgi:hypothetical protein